MCAHHEIAGRLLLVLCLTTLAGSAHAQPAAGPGDPARAADGWRGDIRRFHHDDLARWRAGHWFNRMHDGRTGWWWTVGPMWYRYEAPVYPYPDPYQPPALAAIAPPKPPGTPPQYWYYCADPAGYYPYVPECLVSWRADPAQPLP